MVNISGAYGKLKAWVKAQIAAHEAVSDAHHSKYTDAEVDAIVATHTAIGGAHHSKYTDAEAVAAVDTADDYVKNTGDICTGDITIDRHLDNANPPRMSFWNHANKYAGLFYYDGIGYTDLGAFVAIGSNYSQSSRRGNFEIFARLNNTGNIEFWTKVGGVETAKFKILNDGTIYIKTMQSGATQALSGATAGELWKTSGHATLPDNVLMMGV